MKLVAAVVMRILCGIAGLLEEFVDYNQLQHIIHTEQRWPLMSMLVRFSKYTQSDPGRCCRQQTGLGFRHFSFLRRVGLSGIR